MSASGPDAVTDRHPVLRDADTAEEHLQHRRSEQRWSHGYGEVLDLDERLRLALTVWQRAEHAHRRPGHSLPETTQPSQVDLVAALTVVHHLLRADVDDLESALIAFARSAGVTWEELAPALGQKDRRGAQRYADRLGSGDVLHARTLFALVTGVKAD